MNENDTLSDQLLLSEEYQKIIVEEGIALQVRHIEHSGVSKHTHTHTFNFFLFFINVYTFN